MQVGLKLFQQLAKAPSITLCVCVCVCVYVCVCYFCGKLLSVRVFILKNICWCVMSLDLCLTLLSHICCVYLISSLYVFVCLCFLDSSSLLCLRCRFHGHHGWLTLFYGLAITASSNRHAAAKWLLHQLSPVGRKWGQRAPRWDRHRCVSVCSSWGIFNSLKILDLPNDKTLRTNFKFFRLYLYLWLQP